MPGNEIRVKVLTSSSRSRNRLLVLILCGIGLLLRLAFAYRVMAVSPLWEFWSTGFEPSRIAHSLYTGHGFSSPFEIPTGSTAWIPPVYPALILLAFKLFGTYTYSAAWFMLGLNIICGVAVSAVLYHIGLRCFGPIVAWGGAFLWSVCPDTVAMPIRLWDSNPAALLCTALFLIFLRLLDRSRSKLDWIAFALLSVLAGLTTTTVLAIVPAFLFILSLRGSVKDVALVLCICFVGLLPWTVRNYQRFGRIVPIRDNFGAELWIGNHPGVQGPGDETYHPLQNRSELLDYMRLGESEYISIRQRQAFEFIRRELREFTILTAKRIVSFWTAPRILGGAWLYACMLLAFISILQMLSRGRVLLGVSFASILFLFPISYYLTHAEGFYRYPLEPFIYLLAMRTVLTFVDTKGYIS